MTAGIEYEGTTTVAGTGELTIAGTTYACVRYYSMFQLNAIPYCKAELLPLGSSSFQDLYDKLDQQTVGQDAELTFKFSGKFVNEPSRSGETFTDKSVVVFKGKFMGWSPILMGKSIQVTAWLLHPLCTLDWSSSIVDQVHGRALADPYMNMAAVAGESIVPFMPEPYDDSVTDDIWKNLIKAEMLKIAAYTRFGASNDAALEFLNNYDLSPDELPLSLNAEDAKRVIIDVRRTLYSHFGGNTLWDKLVELSGKYYFAISPRVDGASIIPFTALLGADVETLQYQEFMAENNYIPYLTRFFDGIELIEGMESYSLPFDVVGRKPKSDKLRQSPDNGSDYASAIFKPAMWSQIGNDLSYYSKRSVGGDGSIRAVGYAMSAGQGESDSITPNKTYNDGGTDSENFAKAALNDTLLKQRTAHLRSQLRFDLAPGSLIAVGRPRDVNITPAFYGTVHSVCNSIGAGTGNSGTWIILSNVRNKNEQSALTQYKQHPLYGTTWISAPLTMIDGVTPGLNTGD